MFEKKSLQKINNFFLTGLLFVSFLFVPIITQAIERVSVSSLGVEGDGNPAGDEVIVISEDGRYVLFNSSATNLVAGDTNTFDDLFIYDRTSNTLERLLDGLSIQGDADTGGGISISANNRFVAFSSSATNLVAGDTNGVQDIFVYDRTNDTIERVSVSSLGAEGDSASNFSSISGNGEYVTFGSNAQNLVSGDTSRVDMFIHTLATGSTEIISRNSLGTTSNGDSGEKASDISSDGRYVTFQSFATDLVAGGTLASSHVYVYDQTNQILTLASTNTLSIEGNNASAAPSLSSDGASVTFSSLATNLVTGDTNGYYDVFRKDLSTGETIRISISDTGIESDNASILSSLSADGCYGAFLSYATNLITGDTNALPDIYVVALCVSTPTVSPQTNSSRTPIITGTWDAADATELEVTIGGTTYTLSDSELTTPSSGTWSLDLSSTPLNAGTTYEVLVTNSNLFDSASDTTTNEISITQNSSGGGGSTSGSLPIFGCRDPLATNYN